MPSAVNRQTFINQITTMRRGDPCGRPFLTVLPKKQIKVLTRLYLTETVGTRKGSPYDDYF